MDTLISSSRAFTERKVSIQFLCSTVTLVGYVRESSTQIVINTSVPIFQLFAHHNLKEAISTDLVVACDDKPVKNIELEERPKSVSDIRFRSFSIKMEKA